MRIVDLPANFVKFSIRSKQSPFLIPVAVGVVVILLTASIFVVKRSSAHGVNPVKKKQQGCCADQPVIQRRMIGTYYTTENNFKSILVLNNKGPNQIMVTPILHGRNGQKFTASSVAVGGQSSQEVDLNSLASIAGPQFRAGSFEFTYEGRLLEVGGGLRIVDSEKSLIFDEQMLEPGMKFPSSQLEAIYALPFDSARVNVIVTNTTSQLLAVQGQATFADSIVRFPIIRILKPRETSVVGLPPGLIRNVNAGAVSINHNGPKGALLAMIHLEDASKGYSEAVNFTNPGGKTAELHGAGLRLGGVNNDPLNPMIAVRNLGNNATTVTATIPYSKQNGDTGKIALPQISLAPGAIKLLDTSNPQLKRNDFGAAGLEIEYTGAPGSVITSATTVSQRGDHVFSLPMKDPQGGLSSTGGYPWFITRSSSTTVLIKNVTDDPQQFKLEVIYPGGRWGTGIKSIAANQTIALDMRKLRDTQEKGAEGNTIPLTTSSGHVSWSFRRKPSKDLGDRALVDKILIGRAQTVDLSNGLASTYECQCICGWNPSDARIVPAPVSGFPGDITNFTLQTRDRDCHGNLTGYSNFLDFGSVDYSSDNSSVATFEYPAKGTAKSPGQTYLRALIHETAYEARLSDDQIGTWVCVAAAAALACEAFCNVQACGDERDLIIQEYVDYRNTGVPRCPQFTNTSLGGNLSANFTIAEFNRTNDYTWAVIGFGAMPTMLEQTRANNGNVPLRITSGYRNPARQCGYNLACTGQARDSQHIYGFGVDLQTVTNWTQAAWGPLRQAALQAGACCEPLTESGYSHVHADRRSANPFFRPACPSTWSQ